MRSGDAGVRYVNPPSLERPPGYSHVVDVRGGRLIFIPVKLVLIGFSPRPSAT
jgi:hypothetical protein